MTRHRLVLLALLPLALATVASCMSYRSNAGLPAGCPRPTPACGPLMARDLGDGAGGEKLGRRPGQTDEPASAESYAPLSDNPFVRTATDPRSTFALDVDTASYSNARRFLDQGHLPPADAVRIEEMVNYFTTSDAPPRDGRPLATHLALTRCPWQEGHLLLRVALKAREVDLRDAPPANLVFLIDVSGSMGAPNKLPWVKQSLAMLANAMRSQDRVAVVVYAGAEGLALPSTGDRAAVMAALERLESGGSTNGGAGLRLAYQVAREHLVPGGINRVILCTDGDFNVGVSDRGSLRRLVAEQAAGGVRLTVLGYGMGNLKDDLLETIADRGDGQYAYIDSLAEARRVLVEQASGTLLTVARDVKLQLEFNPATVAGWRLIGYENRLLRHQDFADDRIDAGDLGAGHNVTAFYQLIPAGGEVPAPPTESLRYQQPATAAPIASGDLLTVRLRWKDPLGEASQLVEQQVPTSVTALDRCGDDLRFQAGVAAWGMLLRGSPWAGSADLAMVRDLARGGLGADLHGHRAGFLALVGRTPADGLPPRRAP